MRGRDGRGDRCGRELRRETPLVVRASRLGTASPRARERASRGPDAPSSTTDEKKTKEISPTGFDPVTCGLPIQLFNHYGPTTLPLSYGDRVSLATRETREEARKFCQNPAEQQTYTASRKP